MPLSPLQVAPAPADPVAFVGTFLLGWLFFGFTAQIAASYFLPDPPWRRALLVGLVAATVSVALIRFDTAIIIVVGLLVDAVAIDRIYRPGRRTAVLMTLLHYAATVVIVLFVSNLLALLSTAPS